MRVRERVRVRHPLDDPVDVISRDLLMISRDLRRALRVRTFLPLPGVISRALRVRGFLPLAAALRAALAPYYPPLAAADEQAKQWRRRERDRRLARVAHLRRVRVRLGVGVRIRVGVRLRVGVGARARVRVGLGLG